MTALQTKEEVADAVVSFVNAPPAAEEGNVFIISGKGIIPEAKVQQELLVRK